MSLFNFAQCQGAIWKILEQGFQNKFKNCKIELQSGPKSVGHSVLIISWKHRKRKLTYIHLTFFALITIAFDLRMNLVGFYFWHGAALGVADSTSLGFVFFGLRGHKRHSITIFVEQYWWACCGYLHLIVYSVTNVTWASHGSTATVRSEGSGIIGNDFVTSWTSKEFT